MGKKTWIVIIIVVILVGGGVAYWLSQKDKEEEPTKSNSTSQSTNNSGNKSFAALANNDSDFSAVITSKTDDGKTVAATMEYDKDSGAYSYKAAANGEGVTLIYTKDAYYMCQSADNCIKYPISQNTGFNPGDYSYTQAKLDSYKQSSTYQGQEACPDGEGTCDVWKTSTGGVDSTIYLDSASKKVVQIKTVKDGTESTVAYSYKSVTVTPPANAESMSTNH